MGRSMTPETIPQLTEYGLMPVKTVGNGDCLFNALSDQMHGDDSKAAEYRAAVVDYMRANKNDFLSFIDPLEEEGATRRNPKRKVASKSRYDRAAVTNDVLNDAFEKRLTGMAQGGTWGDNHEIVAFSRLYQVDIMIWAQGVHNWLRITVPDNGGMDKPTLYIVHHTWAHFSSIRRINGPLTGLPNLEGQDQTAEGIAQMDRELIDVEDWKIKIVMKALPHPLNQPANRANVQKTLQQCNGRMDDAVNFLLPDSSPGTSSPSSVERDMDSDDEDDQKPHKKRDRRASRPNPLRSDLAAQVPGRDPLVISPNPIFLAAALKKVANDEVKQQSDPDETEEENWKDHMFHDSSESHSSSASRNSSPPPQRGSTDIPRIRIKLHGPKAQDLNQDSDLVSVASSQSSQSNIADTEADPEDATKSAKKGPPGIAKPRRRRLVPSNQRARLMMQRKARDSDDSIPRALSHTNLLARNNSMKKLDSSIEAISI